MPTVYMQNNEYRVCILGVRLEKMQYSALTMGAEKQNEVCNPDVFTS